MSLVCINDTIIKYLECNHTIFSHLNPRSNQLSSKIQVYLELLNVEFITITLILMSIKLICYFKQVKDNNDKFINLKSNVWP